MSRSLMWLRSTPNEYMKKNLHQFHFTYPDMNGILTYLGFKSIDGNFNWLPYLYLEFILFFIFQENLQFYNFRQFQGIGKQES